MDRAIRISSLMHNRFRKFVYIVTNEENPRFPEICNNECNIKCNIQGIQLKDKPSSMYHQNRIKFFVWKFWYAISFGY